MIHRLGITVRKRELLVEIPDDVSDHVQHAEVEEIKALICTLVKLENARFNYIQLDEQIDTSDVNEMQI